MAVLMFDDCRPVTAATSDSQAENPPVESSAASNASANIPMSEDVGDEVFTSTSTENRGEASGGSNMQE